MRVLYQCTVCKSEHHSKSRWLWHLTSEVHQKVVKRKVEGWDESKVKECCLVVYSNFSMTDREEGGGAHKLIQQFSKDPETLVTDFVCWQEQPRMAIVQFESREAVKRVIRGARRGVEISLDGDTKMVEIKAGERFGTIEWLAMTSGQGKTLLKASSGKPTPAPLPPSPFKPADNKVVATSSSDLPVQRQDPAEKRPREVPKNPVETLVLSPSLEINEAPKQSPEKMETDVPALLPRPSKRPLDLPCGPDILCSSPPSKIAKPDNPVAASSSSSLVAQEDDALKKLFEFTENRGWDRPTYKHKAKPKDEANPLGKMLWSTVVTVNGVTYELPGEKWVEFSQIDKMKGRVAKYCLHRLKEPVSRDPRRRPREEHPVEQGPRDPRIRARETQLLPPTPIAVEPSQTAVVVDPTKESVDRSPQIVWPEDLVHPIFSASWSTPIRGGRDSLAYQFRQILKCVTVRSEDFANLLQVLGALKPLFQLCLPTADVAMFKHCHLKLNISGTFTAPMLYAYDNNCHANFSGSFIPVLDAVVKSVFSLAESQFKVIKMVDFSRQNEQEGSFLYKNPAVLFTLANSPRYFVEVKVCQLLEYMCTFDPRCYPTIILMYYWCRLNNISFEKPTEEQKILPEPLALQWMVVHYFCNKGMIPTVRDIQARPHQAMKEWDYAVDVGFSTDPLFAEEWRKLKKVEESNYSSESFILHLLELFADLLNFYGVRKAPLAWILNTKDGEMISGAQFLAENPTPLPVSNSWLSELSFHPMIVVHPFIFTRRFAMPTKMNTVLNAMNQTSKLVQMFTKAATMNGIADAVKHWGNLKSVLTVDPKLRSQLEETNAMFDDFGV